MMANLIRQVARVIETKWGRFHICAKGLYFWDEMTTCYLFKKKYWDQWHHASWSSIWWQGAFLGWKLKLIIKATTCVEHTTLYFRMIRVSKRNAWKLKKLKKSYFEKKSANFWHIKNYSRIRVSTNVCYTINYEIQQKNLHESYSTIILGKAVEKRLFRKKSANFWHMKNYSRIRESTNVIIVA